MKVWIFITLWASVALSFAYEQSVWVPECSALSGSDLIPHPVDCRKFFVCIRGTAFPLTCPYGFTWNSILNKCSTAFVCENNSAPKYNPLCPLYENPAHPTHLPDLNDCGKFYECESSFAFHLACPAGLHWSVDFDSCVDPLVANCKFTSAPVIGNGLLNAACPTTDDPENPIYLPHPEDCTQFFKCSLGKSYVVSCPYGLHWNDKSNRCDSPYIAKCKRKQQEVSTMLTSTRKKPLESTVPTSTNQPISLTTKPPAHVPVCPNNGIKNFGIPGQCDKYYSCSQGKLYIMNCRAGREWSEITKGCVQSSLADCTGIGGANANTISTEKNPPNPFLPVLSSTITNPTSTVSSNLPNPFLSALSSTSSTTSCSPGIDLLSHPTDCHKFIVCDNGKQIEKSCPDGLFFSRKTSRCQWTNDHCEIL